MNTLPVSSEEQRLHQKIGECKQRWDALSKRLNPIQKRRDSETRVEEQLRLDEEIKTIDDDRQQVDLELKTLESELKKLQLQTDKDRLVQDARRAETNRAFAEAIALWEEIKQLDHNDSSIDGKIQRVKERQKQAEPLDEYIKGLLSRCVEIKPVYLQVITRLNQMKETGTGHDSAIFSSISSFLENKLPAEQFIELWQTLVKKSAPDPTGEPDYQELAVRLKLGEIVLFLGSDMCQLLDIMDAPVPSWLVQELAKRAKYENFSGSLSMIAEFYQMTDYGRLGLLRNLQALIKSVVSQIPLYGLVASISEPLIVISAAYDMFIETAFQQSGKKYALVSSATTKTPGVCDIGNLVVQCSDQPTVQTYSQGTDLSTLRLMESGYSLIYKIRGCCNPENSSADHRYDTWTLTEENYFTFARNTDKLIPNYVIKQLGRRGLCFLGYTPRDWEDRLLVDVILEMRSPYSQSERAFTVSNDNDRFLRAYWESRGVKRYQIDLKDFASNLEKYLR